MAFLGGLSKQCKLNHNTDSCFPPEQPIAETSWITTSAHVFNFLLPWGFSLTRAGCSFRTEDASARLLLIRIHFLTMYMYTIAVSKQSLINNLVYTEPCRSILSISLKDKPDNVLHFSYFQQIPLKRSENTNELDPTNWYCLIYRIPFSS